MFDNIFFLLYVCCMCAVCVVCAVRVLRVSYVLCVSCVLCVLCMSCVLCVCLFVCWMHILEKPKGKGRKIRKQQETNPDRKGNLKSSEQKACTHVFIFITGSNHRRNSNRWCTLRQFWRLNFPKNNVSKCAIKHRVIISVS